MNMTPSICNQIRDELNKVLPDIGKKLGISLKMGNGSYTHSTATLKVEAAVLTPDGEAQTKEAIAFKQFATSYGLKPTDLGREFSTMTGTYKIVGLATRSWKMPILATQNGKMYKFPADVVTRKLYPTVIQPKTTTYDNAGETGLE